MGLFTLPEARAELVRLRPILDEIVTVRADLVELSAALVPGGEPTPLGGLPERKAAEARLNELMTDVQQTGAELKGMAPLLVDFPGDLDGVPVMLCWLEGDSDITWYHRADLGFAGRRPLPETAHRPQPATEHQPATDGQRQPVTGGEHQSVTGGEPQPFARGERRSEGGRHRSPEAG